MFEFLKNFSSQSTAQRTTFFLTGDAALSIVAVYMAFLLRFDGNIPGQHFPHLLLLLATVPVSIVLVFLLLKIYRLQWSFVGIGDIINILKGVTAVFFVAGLLIFVLRDSPISHPLLKGFPRSVILISYFLIFLLLSGFRLSKRIFVQLFSERTSKGSTRVLIVGAGEAGEQIVRNMLAASPRSYFPVGFVDDDVSKIGSVVHGIRVAGSIDEIPGLVSLYQVQELIIALPSAGSGPIKKAVEKGREAGLTKIRIVPSLAELMSGEASLSALREVQVEDLLGREPFSLDPSSLEEFLKGKTILITGAAGSIGFELSRQVARFGPSKLVLLDQDETGIFHVLRDMKAYFPELQVQVFIANIRDQGKMRQILSAQRPTVVFHAAAYKHVPLLEDHLDEAVKNNVFGTQVLARASIEYGVDKFIFISTDKAVNPSSVMGMTKRIGEMMCQVFNQQHQTKFISVRFGNVLESRGSVIPLFKEQIAKRGPVQVTHPEMKRYFMMNSEACLLVMQAGAMGQGGEVFVLDMGQPVSIVDLAKEMIRLSGFEPDRDIPIVFTGIRPGEKLFEDILTAEEGTMATHHQKIFTAKLTQVNGEFFSRYLQMLREKVDNGTKEEIRAVLQAFYKRTE